MQIANLNSDVYFNILPYISIKDALNLKKTCKKINTLLSSDLFSKNVPSCRKLFQNIFTFRGLYPHFLDIQSFRVNLLGSILYDASNLKEKIQVFIEESCRLLMSNHNNWFWKGEEESFFQNEKLFLWLEEHGFSQSLSTMQREKYIKAGNQKFIRELCLIVQTQMTSPFHKEAVQKIFDHVFNITLERAMEKVKKAIIEKPYLLDIFKTDCQMMSSQIIDSVANVELWQGFFKELDYFKHFFGSKNINVEKISPEFFQNRFKEVLNQIEKELKL